MRASPRARAPPGQPPAQPRTSDPIVYRLKFQRKPTACSSSSSFASPTATSFICDSPSTEIQKAFNIFAGGLSHGRLRRQHRTWGIFGEVGTGSRLPRGRHPAVRRQERPTAACARTRRSVVRRGRERPPHNRGAASFGLGLGADAAPRMTPPQCWRAWKKPRRRRPRSDGRRAVGSAGARASRVEAAIDLRRRLQEIDEAARERGIGRFRLARTLDAPWKVRPSMS